MKSAAATSASSSSMTPSTAVRARYLGRGGNRSAFPSCRRDDNCHCDICLASIHATLDLIPSGSAIKQSCLTKLSTARPTPLRASPLFDEDDTPPTPPDKSRKKKRKEKSSWGFGYWVWGILTGLCLCWAVDSGAVAAILKDFGPKLRAETVVEFGEEARDLPGDLRVKLRSLQQMVGGVGELVYDCSSMDSNWDLIQQDGHTFFYWRCVMYQSLAEEVSVWGSPLQTSGLIATGFLARSMTVLSGRITEWSEGRLASTSRTTNSSCWTSEAWKLTAVQLEADTWVVEYQRSILFQDPGVTSAALKMVSERAVRAVKELKHDPSRILMLRGFRGFGPCRWKKNPFDQTT